MLQLNEQNRIPELDHCYICGELALSGELRPVRGALAIALEASKRRRERLIVPHQNAAEAAVVVYQRLNVFELIRNNNFRFCINDCPLPTEHERSLL